MGYKWILCLMTKAAGNSLPEIQSLVNKPLKAHLEKLENWLAFSHQAWDEKQTWELPIFISLHLETVFFICRGNQLGRREAERLCETRTNTLQFHLFPPEISLLTLIKISLRLCTWRVCFIHHVVDSVLLGALNAAGKGEKPYRKMLLPGVQAHR